MPRCFVTGLSSANTPTDTPPYLTLSVVLANHSTFYTHPASHVLNRVACSHSTLRGIREDRRPPPVNHPMTDCYAILSQPDLFHSIDNTSGDRNDSGNMLIIQYHVRAYKTQEVPPHMSLSSIFPKNEWPLDSQRHFVRTNLKYLSDPRVLYAHDKEI